MLLGKHGTPKPLQLALIVACATIVLLVVIVTFLSWRQFEQDRTAASQGTATAEMEKSLTAIYGAEVRTTIETFESRWLSLEAHTNPSLQSELATGPYLDYWGYARQGSAIYDEPVWLVTRSATVQRLAVLEHGSDRIKAVAHVVIVSDEITPKGVFKQSLAPDLMCGVYVFVRESDTWKLAAYFNATDPRYVDRDWSEAPDWLKRIIGDLPSEAVRDCNT